MLIRTMNGTLTHNVEAMTSKGLRSDELSTDTELDAS
jgi:hypothetical protein